MNISAEKLKRIQTKMAEYQLDALFCRLSEHVLYFTGYWPRGHVGAAVIPATGKPVLLVGELEAKLELGANPPSVGVDVVTFPFESHTVARGPNDGFGAVLPGVFRQLGLTDKRIGIEQNIEGCNVGVFQGEVKYPAEPTWAMLKKLFPDAKLKDASGLIFDLRSVKSDPEIEAIKLAAEIAGFGYEAASREIRAGMSEAELASVVESAIHTRGTGYKGVTQARGYACVYTGARSAIQWSHYAYSQNYKIQPKDVVIIELGAFADGYWADLTRNFCAGEPETRAKEIFRIAQGAQRAAIEAAMPGTPASALEKAAREYMHKFSYADNWPHGLGHGVGFAYHEGPSLHAANPNPITAGMVLTFEPGIYIEGYAGFRPEDMVVIREAGPEVISAAIPHVFQG